MTDFGESVPKLGHVNEVCREWILREDGALAYRLQSQEINDYYKGNKFRNALVRQDFPTALNEQKKEKEIAEKQQALYHHLLCEQEKADKQYAEKLARTIEKDSEECPKEDKIGEIVAKQMQNMYANSEIQNENYPPFRDTEINNKISERSRITSSNNIENQIFKRHYVENIEGNFINANFVDDRHVFELDSIENVASNSQHFQPDIADSIRHYDLSNNRRVVPRSRNENAICPLTENDFTNNCNLPIQPSRSPDFIRQANADINLQELGLTPEEFDQLETKLHQEKKDEELARYLQEQEQEVILTQEEKDRLLAIEAQDKELARMLQEREKAKVKRAKEKARLRRSQQKSLNATKTNIELEDSYDQNPYSNPVDSICDDMSGTYLSDGSIGKNTNRHSTGEDGIYSLPIDVCPNSNRPTSLDIKETPPRSETSRWSTSEVVTPLTSKSPSSGERDASPVPPYMPSQNTRQNSSGKKKKYKEKCAHQ